MTRKEMMDKVIRINGFENQWTIWFCKLAENPTVDEWLLLRAMACAILIPNYKYIKEALS